jgi:hypothetical protein
MMIAHTRMIAHTSDAYDRVGIVTHSPSPAEVGQIAIVDFFHWENDDFTIVPPAGWTLHKTHRGDGITVVRFRKIVTAHESASFWTFNRPAAVFYLVDYL